MLSHVQEFGSSCAQDEPRALGGAPSTIKRAREKPLGHQLPISWSRLLISAQPPKARAASHQPPTPFLLSPEPQQPNISRFLGLISFPPKLHEAKPAQGGRRKARAPHGKARRGTIHPTLRPSPSKAARARHGGLAHTPLLPACCSASSPASIPVLGGCPTRLEDAKPFPWPSTKPGVLFAGIPLPHRRGRVPGAHSAASWVPGAALLPSSSSSSSQRSPHHPSPPRDASPPGVPPPQLPTCWVPAPKGRAGGTPEAWGPPRAAFHSSHVREGRSQPFPLAPAFLQAGELRGSPNQIPGANPRDSHTTQMRSRCTRSVAPSKRPGVPRVSPGSPRCPQCRRVAAVGAGATQVPTAAPSWHRAGLRPR